MFRRVATYASEVSSLALYRRPGRVLSICHALRQLDETQERYRDALLHQQEMPDPKTGWVRQDQSYGARISWVVLNPFRSK